MTATTPEARAVALLPCPFCGAPPEPVPQDSDFRLKDGTGFQKSIWCALCGISGPVRTTSDGSSAAWNTRASDAVPARQGDAEVVRAKLVDLVSAKDQYGRAHPQEVASAILAEFPDIALPSSPPAPKADLRAGLEKALALLQMGQDAGRDFSKAGSSVHDEVLGPIERALARLPAQQPRQDESGAVAFADGNGLDRPRAPSTAEDYQLHVTIPYTNWRGEFGMREIASIRLFHGSNEWHPQPQWLIEAWDVGKNKIRTFALAGIGQPPAASDRASGVTDAAVDVAVEAYLKATDWGGTGQAMRAALEAALPHLAPSISGAPASRDAERAVDELLASVTISWEGPKKRDAARARVLAMMIGGTAAGEVEQLRRALGTISLAALDQAREGEGRG